MRAVVLCAVFLALPSSAHAATLVKSGSTLTYTAAPGRASTVTFSVPDPGQPGSVRVARAGDGDPIQATGCAPAGQDFTCTGHRRGSSSTLGDGTDFADARTFTGTVAFDGGPGADQLYGGAAADTLDGGDGDDVLDGGAGNDTISGSAGDDALNGGTGADALSGGAGLDAATHVMLAAAPRRERLARRRGQRRPPGRGRQLRVRHRGRVDPRPGRRGADRVDADRQRRPERARHRPRQRHDQRAERGSTA